MRRIRREAERAFESSETSALDDLHDESDDIPEHDNAESVPVPEVSILPIPEEDSEALPSFEDAPNDVPLIFVGRSEEEVLNAFERLEEEVQAESVIAASSIVAPKETETEAGAEAELEVEENTSSDDSQLDDQVVMHEEL